MGWRVFQIKGGVAFCWPMLLFAFFYQTISEAQMQKEIHFCSIDENILIEVKVSLHKEQYPLESNKFSHCMRKINTTWPCIFLPVSHYLAYPTLSISLTLSEGGPSHFFQLGQDSLH